MIRFPNFEWTGSYFYYFSKSNAEDIWRRITRDEETLNIKAQFVVFIISTRKKLTEVMKLLKTIRLNSRYLSAGTYIVGIICFELQHWTSPRKRKEQKHLQCWKTLFYCRLSCYTALLLQVSSLSLRLTLSLSVIKRCWKRH